MRPLILHGHERAITQIKYNREGDLLFTASKGKEPNVWFSENGELLGSFVGHNGVIWSIDVDWRTEKMISGSGDQSWRLWDCETGKSVNVMQNQSVVRSVGFSYSGNEFFYVLDSRGGTTAAQSCFIVVKDLRSQSHMQGDDNIMKLECMDSKITSAVWGALDETIITGHSNGDLSLIQMRERDWGITKTARPDISSEKGPQAHTATVTDIQKSKDDIFIVSASKDTTAMLFDSMTLDHMKTYKAGRPVNSAAISPIRQHVLVGGGQEAMEVTTTDVRQGKFEARFFHMVFEEEFARVRGHFGPINSTAFHPSGRSFATGGEDGYVRVHQFDTDYYEFELQC